MFFFSMEYIFIEKNKIIEKKSGCDGKTIELSEMKKMIVPQKNYFQVKFSNYKNLFYVCKQSCINCNKSIDIFPN